MKPRRPPRRPGVVSDREIAQLPGGPRVLAARDAAVRLVERFPGLRASPGGALDGWSGIARRGRIEHLLPGEHVEDEHEFLRRHFDGEQLYLARGSAGSGAASALIAWDFTVAGLGSPRLVGLGAALALKRRLEEDGGSFRLCMNGGAALDLSTRKDLQLVLELAPATDLARGAYREMAAGGGEPSASSVHWMASEPDLPDPEAVAGPAAGGEPALVVAGAETIRLLVRRCGRAVSWEEVARTHIPGGVP